MKEWLGFKYVGFVVGYMDVKLCEYFVEFRLVSNWWLKKFLLICKDEVKYLDFMFVIVFVVD